METAVTISTAKPASGTGVGLADSIESEGASGASEDFVSVQLQNATPGVIRHALRQHYIYFYKPFAKTARTTCVFSFMTEESFLTGGTRTLSPSTLSKAL